MDQSELTAQSEMAIDTGHSTNTTLLRDSFVNCAGTVVTSLLGLMTVPLLLRGLGADVYGLWIASSALAGIAGTFDLGLEWALTREVAAATGAGDRAKAAPFVRSAALAYFVIGLVGGLLVASAGGPLSRLFGLETSTHQFAPAIFAFAGVSLFASQVWKFCIGVLEGMRRFDVTNILTTALALLRAGGIVVFVACGARLWPIIWYTAIHLFIAMGALLLVGCLEPRFRRGSLLKKCDAIVHLRFGIVSQINASLTKVIWESGPVIIGGLAGPEAVVVLHIGQRLSSALSMIGDRAAAVIFPAAGETDGRDGCVNEAELLRSGTRAVLVLSLPACAIMWTLAPALLRAWIPGVEPASITIARICVVAVLLDAFAIAAVHVGWASGSVGRLTAVSTAAAVIVLVLTASFARPFLGVGVATAFLAAIGFGAVLNIGAECRHAKISPLGLMAGAIRPLVLPALAACMASASIICFVPGAWTSVVLASLAAVVVYSCGFIAFAADEQERLLLRRMIRPLNLAWRF
jgi:O-antigen/teichoic acid export membrane protein